ncbi:MAG: hypothetical protein Q8L84_09220 [Hyphomonas sp.]|nr:hypothetical protein [Hyphomonas sp.]
MAHAPLSADKDPLTDGSAPQVAARPVGHAMTCENSRAARRLA